MYYFSILFCIYFTSSICLAQEGPIYASESLVKHSSIHTIEGRVFPSPNSSITPSWFIATRIIVNYGQFIGFMK